MDDDADVDLAWARFCREYAASENLDTIRAERSWIDDNPVPIVDDHVLSWRRHFATRWRDQLARPLIAIKTYTYSFTLDQRLDDALFWAIPVIPYEMEHVGVVAKELRVVSRTADDVAAYRRALADHQRQWPHAMVRETVFAPPTPDVLDYRRLQLGIVGKQLRVVARRPRRAFSHCIVVYLRWRPSGTREYLETHVKMFTTGQVDVLGLPGHDTQFREVFWRTVILPMGAATLPRVIERPVRPLLLTATLWFGCHVRIPPLRECLATRGTVLDRESTVVRCRYRDHEYATCTTFWTGSLLFSGACSSEALECVAQLHVRALLEWIDLIHDTAEVAHVKKHNARNHDNKFTYEMDMEPGETVDPAPDLWRPRAAGERVRLCVDEARFQYFVGEPFGVSTRKTQDAVNP